MKGIKISTESSRHVRPEYEIGSDAPIGIRIDGPVLFKMSVTKNGPPELRMHKHKKEE